MSTHPNVILLLVLTPDELARKTYRDILAYSGVDPNDDLDNDVKIGGLKYHHKVMEVAYEESFQIEANEGDIIFFNLVTYGYGEKILWSDLENHKTDLWVWAKDICEKFNCSFDIFISANYW